MARLKKLKKRTFQPYAHGLDGAVHAYGFEFAWNAFEDSMKSLYYDVIGGKVGSATVTTERSRTSLSLNTGIGYKDHNTPVPDFGDSTWAEYNLGIVNIVHSSAPDTTSSSASKSRSGAGGGSGSPNCCPVH